MRSSLRFALTCATAILGVMVALASRAADAPPASSPGPEVTPPDDIVLNLAHGPSAGQVILSWVGGLPDYNVFRSTTVPVLISPVFHLGTTASPGWFDVPPVGDIFYYEVRGQGCASDAGCPTGHCADRYCCDAACSDPCMRCDLTGAEGTCLPAASGTDPGGDCGAQGRCDGTGVCLLIDGATCTTATQCLSGLCTIFFRDADGDGFGSSTIFAAACGSIAPAGYATNFTDCNDAEAATHPGAFEIVGDEIDENCDLHELCYRDGDGDGFRATLVIASSDVDCADPGEARGTAPADCCDTSALVHPGQTTYFTTAGSCGGFDYNCDGAQTQRFGTIASGSLACGGTPPLCIDLGTGWVTSVAACGVTASYRDCSSTCGTVTISLTQSCR